ncbi:DUF6777 domain-containing protein [Streptomyces sp. HUAS TT20]|uniref:DUF6777 domain-containing protein n=1 Tax=Streptomyces sp. HUAS TT20 TaxID=3447509 RepID=UPI0021DA2EFE|nr:DUF6777 domain-containing protein [Streptomyces sp. HUAS 15-9]UXY25838.1 hypothetical protein N8I87_04100 [Streptomyces sp. HUAS 15-9]
MSVEPPSSGRPTGPPSGPLSGAQPPSGPPPQPPAGGGPGAPEPHQPWWRSAPRIALLTTGIVVAVIVAVVLSNAGGGGTAKASEVFLQAANSTGQDPFTGSTAKSGSVTPITPSATTTSATGNELHSVRGGDPGLYAGTRNTPSCDVEKQVRELQASRAKNNAFASVVGIRPSAVPAYLRSLTPVQLRVDTRVTDHGYRNGTATDYQAVLQTGTAVLVDGHGVPRVRCVSGNPLTPPVAQRTPPKPVGDRWASYRPSAVVVVRPAPRVINIFIIFDGHNDEWIQRHRGDHTGEKDHRTKPPEHQVNPWATPYTPPTAPTSPTSPTSPATTGPSSPTTSSPSPESPKSESPTTESPSSESPPSESPPTESPSTEAPSSETPTYESPPSEGGTVTESLAPESPAAPETQQQPEVPSNVPELDTGNVPAPQDTGGQSS